MTHPKKWYIPVTKENHEELNRWRLSKRTIEASKWDDGFVPGSVLVSEHPLDGSYYWSSSEESFNEWYPFYREITLEQFRQITNTKPMKHPKKWYIPVTNENHKELQAWWREKVRKSGWNSNPNARLHDEALVLSRHPIDGSYYYMATESVLKAHYPSYEKITLEQFRQITNTKPMTHPEHWCIEATRENFSELKAWWEKSVPGRYYYFQVGYTLMSDHPRDESKYYVGDIKNCIEDYPEFVEITLEQFREITNSNQTTMSKQIEISRELLNEYYNAATTPQKIYLTKHFKLDGTTTVEAIRGLHDMACEGWKPRIKKNHPDCFTEDSKYFDFSEHVSNKGNHFVPAGVCHSLGLNVDFIRVRNSDNPELHHRSFYLSAEYNWELVQDNNTTVLIPTKKRNDSTKSNSMCLVW